MAKFHPLKVADIRKETADCVSIAFEIPKEFENEYNYTQGQYVTIKMLINGEEIRRSYSLCSSPLADADFRIAAKKVKDGRMSVALNDTIKVGDVLEVMTPMGNFYNINQTNNKNIVLFAGGSGITPMLSIIKTVLKEDATCKLTLFYGNQNEASTIFKTELDELAKANSSRFNLIYIFDEAPANHPILYTGLISKEKVMALVENHVGLNFDNEFFICGPTPMMKNVEESLQSLQIKKENIHLEYFTASLDANKTAEPVNADSSEKVISQITVILDGDETTFELASDGKNILDAAMDQDVDVPFSCKGAVCCTCRAKVLEGKVHMKANYALTEDEVAEGFILTCQAHPLTPVVVVDYDV
jgi:ring-1,2-phenylacetyl-CoA epoxidase subunit PaaE